MLMCARWGPPPPLPPRLTPAASQADLVAQAIFNGTDYCLAPPSTFPPDDPMRVIMQADTLVVAGELQAPSLALCGGDLSIVEKATIDARCATLGPRLTSSADRLTHPPTSQ